MSPTDEHFDEATESTSPVYPATAKERTTVKRGREQAVTAYKSGDVAEAKALSDATSAQKTALDKCGAMFELVCRCLKDAESCEKVVLDVIYTTAQNPDAGHATGVRVLGGCVDYGTASIVAVLALAAAAGVGGCSCRCCGGRIAWARGSGYVAGCRHDSWLPSCHVGRGVSSGRAWARGRRGEVS